MDLSALKNKFISIFGDGNYPIRYFMAPGRINLIGEHTDYNGGYALPAALNLKTIVAIRKRDDSTIKLSATDLNNLVIANIEETSKYKNLKWGNYQIGVIEQFIKSEYKISGCEMLFDTDIPFGAGLSSSASIEVSTALAIIGINSSQNINLNKVDIAKLSQKAENEFVGVQCGILDQFASIMGKSNNVVFLNCSNLDYEYIPVNFSDYKLIIINTNKKRSLAGSKYNERRSECNKAFQILKKTYPELKTLSELKIDDFQKYESLLEDKVLIKRVKHIITENNRVTKSKNLLINNKLNEFGKLINESHLSLKENYEVTCYELDILHYESLKLDGVLGTRMTGAGFGGCTLSIVNKNNIKKFTSTIEQIYIKKTSLVPTIHEASIGSGAKEIIV